ncbi:ABC transporter ATP-binding protein [Pseudonocardia sp. RS010]|uniref:ABC transporter ATP-binding protein n=1 Tax=Pseudonocardia sp. RS010 TaxID=3385979 RepID=UPI0039A0F75B
MNAAPSPPSRAAVRTESLGLAIGGARIVSRVDMEIAEGEFIGVIGPNGAGKTSLLNLLTGTTRATEGAIHLLGRDVTRLAPHRRARLGVGRTFQTSYLLLGLTVRENVRLMVQSRTVRGPGLLRFVTAGDDTSQRAEEALARVGLADKADLTVAELSHGDRRKVEIAVVLAADARLVLFDEPMAGVNSADVDGLVELIREVHRGGTSVIMVEHHMHVVLGLADRVAVMHNGELLALDRPDAVMADDRVQTAYLGEPL